MKHRSGKKSLIFARTVSLIMPSQQKRYRSDKKVLIFVRTVAKKA